jgi:SAM-dependent methyltransferase
MAQALDDADWGSTIQNAAYWDARYARDAHHGGGEDEGSGAAATGTFEWYVSYGQIEGLLDACLRPRGGHVLEIGCGNSELALGLHAAGYDVTATDYAAGQIELLNRQHAALVASSAASASLPSLRFEAIDCRALEAAYGAAAFDAVVDKACLDSMLSGDADTAKATCRQVSRVLKPGGHFVVISHAAPEGDLGDILLREIILNNVDLERFRWDVNIHSSEELGDDFVHVYVLQKVERPRTRLELARRRDKVDRLAGVTVQRHWH